jgi:nucleoid DNA-binding protein
MKRKQLGRDVARTTHLTASAAQDRVDELVHEILRRLRAGEPVNLKELGLPEITARPAGAAKQ